MDHSTAIILIILIGLSSISWFMFDILGASITIAASIVGVGIVIWDGFRRQRDSLEKTYGAMNIMNKYLENTSKAGVYEKIAILHGYTN